MSNLNPLVDHSKKRKLRELKDKGGYSYLDKDREELLHEGDELVDPD